MKDDVCQTGKVMELKGDIAVIRFHRSDACGHCNACFRFGSNEADIEIENRANAEAGDTVVIELYGGSMFKASAIMYGVPLIGLVVGVAIGSTLGDVYAAVGGILLCAGAFFIIRAFEPKFRRMNEFKPRMVEVVKPTEGQKKEEE